MSAAPNDSVMDCYVSYIEKYAPDFTACAETARRWFCARGFKASFVTDSRPEWFWGPEVQKARGVFAAGSNSIEGAAVILHHAHGSHRGFHVATKNSANEYEVAEVADLSPGHGEARYLWLISCSSLQHGSRPAEPHLFDGHPKAKNAFLRWGQTYRENGYSWSPLAGGIRLVCGSSTYIKVREDLLSPVFRLIDAGVPIADAYILGQTNETQTPLCATRGASIDENPLYDRVWTSEAAPGGDLIFIQYPVRDDEAENLPLSIAGEYPQGGDATEVQADLPKALPIFPLRFDEDRTAQFAEIAETAEDIPGLQADHLAESGSLKLTVSPTEAGSSTAYSLIQSVLQQALSQAIFGEPGSVEQRHDVEWIRQQIDGFRDADLHLFGQGNFKPSSILRKTKKRHRLAKPAFRLPELPDFEFRLLDPDIGPLLGMESEIQPVEGGGPPSAEAGKLDLLVRGWQRGKDHGESKPLGLIGSHTAQEQAWQAVESSGNFDVERIDKENPGVSIGYRLHSSESRPGRLMPHYVVSYRSTETDAPIATIELPAINNP